MTEQKHVLFQKRKGLKIHLIDQQKDRSFCTQIHVDDYGSTSLGDFEEVTCEPCQMRYEFYLERLRDKAFTKKYSLLLTDITRWESVDDDIRFKVLELEHEYGSEFVKDLINSALREKLESEEEDQEFLKNVYDAVFYVYYMLNTRRAEVWDGVDELISSDDQEAIEKVLLSDAFINIVGGDIADLFFDKSFFNEELQKLEKLMVQLSGGNEKHFNQLTEMEIFNQYREKEISPSEFWLKMVEIIND